MTFGTDQLRWHRDAVRARLLESGQAPPGPGSMSWTINREIVVVAGWGRAVLLQLAHPVIAAGVRDHSSFRASLLTRYRRLRSTVNAMLSLTFGDTRQMIAAAATINAIHDRVRGRVPERTGLEYSAHDPVLQRWVHATLLESILSTYQLLVGPLTREQQDWYCREAAIMEPLLGMPAGWLPRDVTQLEIYLRDMRTGGAIDVTGTSRSIARALLYPPRWRAAWPLFRPLQLLTIGMLPPAMRAAYGFEWGEREARAFARTASAVRGAVRLMPDAMRAWPMARAREGRLRRDSRPRFGGYVEGFCRRTGFRPGS
jgi:uncharacterized protein (DUF2236 family)